LLAILSTEGVAADERPHHITSMNFDDVYDESPVLVPPVLVFDRVGWDRLIWSEARFG
jgi:hypothetical protein